MTVMPIITKQFQLSRLYITVYTVGLTFDTCDLCSRVHVHYYFKEGFFCVIFELHYVYLCCLFGNTHTHPLNGPLSGTTRVIQYW